jgi:colanic acid biosynthesis glycosyl transferase WcaI
MRVLLFSNLYRPEPTGVGPLSGGLADALVRAGHEVHVIAANPSYPEWKLFPGFSPWAWSVRNEGGVHVHRVPVFIPRRVRGLTRMLHYGTFAAAGAFPALKLALRFRPDVVMQAAPTLVASPVALACAQIARAVSWLHIQDFEVEAGFATGELNGSGYVARSALAYERAILRAFDRVSSISPEMCAKLVSKGVEADRVYELRNWADIEGIVPLDHSAYREEFGITTPHVVLYSGALAAKQGLETIAETARLLSARTDVTFVVCGRGPARAMLERAAADLPNLVVADLQPKERLGELLALATIHILPQRKDAADLVLPSKLANMLASGRPVVAGAAPGTGLAREIRGVGTVCEPENAEAFAAAISTLLERPDERLSLGQAARERAVSRWSQRQIVDRFVAELVEARQCAVAAGAV